MKALANWNSWNENKNSKKETQGPMITNLLLTLSEREKGDSKNHFFTISFKLGVTISALPLTFVNYT